MHTNKDCVSATSTHLSQLINCAPRLPFGSSLNEIVKSFGCSVLVEWNNGSGIIGCSFGFQMDRSVMTDRWIDDGRQ